MGEEIKNLYDIDVTMISNSFLEDHLQDADPFYIKVYIYYLWKKLDKIDIKQAADDLNLTDNDVERAIKYWISKKVLTKNSIKKSSEVKNDNIVPFKEKKEELLSKKDSVIKSEDEEGLKEILFFAQQILPNTISNPQVLAIKEMYYRMKLPIEVVEYLIEYIAQNETYTAKYMLTIANSWYEQGIKSKDEAKVFTEQFSKDKKVKKTKSSKKKSSLDRENFIYDSSMDISLDNKEIFK